MAPPQMASRRSGGSQRPSGSPRGHPQTPGGPTGAKGGSSAAATDYANAFGNSALAREGDVAVRYDGSGGKERKNAKANGPLLSRLRELRAESEGDTARLRSGQYHFRPHSKAARSAGDDPRQRALIHFDVTVVRHGGPSTPSAAMDSSQTSLDLGLGASLAPSIAFVHCVPPKKLGLEPYAVDVVRDSREMARAVWTQIALKAPLLHARGPTSGRGVVGEKAEAEQGLFVEIFFNGSTARQLAIGEGSQLRLYDPIWLLPAPTCRAGDDSCGSGGSEAADSRGLSRDAGAGDSEGAGLPKVICTQLSEKYPDQLPPLSPPPPWPQPPWQTPTEASVETAN